MLCNNISSFVPRLENSTTSTAIVFISSLIGLILWNFENQVLKTLFFFLLSDSLFFSITVKQVFAGFLSVDFCVLPFTSHHFYSLWHWYWIKTSTLIKLYINSVWTVKDVLCGLHPSMTSWADYMYPDTSGYVSRYLCILRIQIGLINKSSAHFGSKYVD